jgi:Tol biopolymer transport system component
MARIPGTSDEDELVGFPGNDRILGFGGNDRLFGNQGNDLLIGHGGKDQLRGGPGRDRLQGGTGNDLLFGDEDDDVLIAAQGNDELQGGPGVDRLQGGAGRDLLFGGEDDDTLRGNAGRDELQGGLGGDRLGGGGGNDRLFGETGNDALVGGGGADEFVVESIADGLDDILDFDMAEFDFLTISTALTGFESGDDIDGYVRADATGGDTIVLINPDGAGNDFTPVFRLTNEEIDLGVLTSYGMEFEPINPDLLPLRSNASLSTDNRNVSTSAAISADGRFVAFQTKSNELDQPNRDSDGVTQDIFIKDFATGSIVRVSTNVDDELADNSQLPLGQDLANANSFAPAMSSDARFVAFHSDADNLVPGDTNQSVDIFVKNVLTGQVVRASTSDDGAQGVETRGTDLDPLVDPLSSNASLSADGGVVAFQSKASNLVGFDPNDDGSDVFVKDLSTGEIQRIAAPDGNLGRNPMLSGDGSALVFETFKLLPGESGPVKEAQNVVLTDLAGGRSTIIAPASDEAFFQAAPVVSADGRFVAFASDARLTQEDNNGETDVYIFDQLLNTTDLVSANSAGQVASSPFEFPAALSSSPSISDDGRFVAFAGDATNLVPGDRNGLSDIFVKDTLTGLINLVSLNSDGSQIADDRDSAGGATAPVISGDGRSVAFESGAQSLQPEADPALGPDVTVFLTSTGFGDSGPAALDPLLTPSDPALA